MNCRCVYLPVGQTYRLGLAMMLVWVLLGGFAPQLRATEPPEYNRDIRPILADNCFACHGADSAARKADLRLDQRDAAIEFGAITAGNPDESELIARIFSDEPDAVMPPPETKQKLTSEQKEKLKRWIAAGAEYQPHWSLIAPQKTQPPTVKNEAWVKNAIDRFILAKLEERGLSPAPEADPHALFRRLHFDITGLPPAPQDVSAFVGDYAAGKDVALSAWIDRLMKTSAWGEHRARYWLDAARYGDTHGLHFDNYREMWPYRDWVIRAFNANRPFDQFTIEQIAGDLLPGATDDQLIASGFQRCNITTNEGGTIDEENVANYAADRVQTFGWVYLGLTTNCAQCHDHKFDPFTMQDYYSLSAFFRNTTQGAKDGNVKDGLGPVLVLPSAADALRWKSLPEEIARAKTNRDERRKNACSQYEQWLATAAPESLQAFADGAPLRAILARPAQERTPEQQAALYDHYLVTRDPQYPALAKTVADLEAEREAIRARSPITHIQEEAKDTQAMAHILTRGAYDKQGDKVKATTPSSLHPMPEGAPKNRLGLALWLVDPANPRTARVAVNRFWQEVFGQGIIATPEDFGVRGAQPSHPELLDLLAVEFRESGWDVKQLFKLMLTSATYRQAAVTTPEKLDKDRDNALLSRGPRFRMDAEMVRDNALAVSGLLSSKMYGPGVKPYQPEGIWEIVGLPGGNTRSYEQSKGEELYRRTIYSFWKRMAPPPNLEAFNAPSREVCNVRRERTNTPLQALVSLNDPQFVEAARQLAQNALLAGDGNDAKAIEYISQRVLCRHLNEREQAILLTDKQEFLAYYQREPDAARALIGVGESNPDEKLAVSQLAAWTMVCNQVMNLDEALNK
jgi:mono/diheme cytochrome c family protein